MEEGVGTLGKPPPRPRCHQPGDVTMAPGENGARGDSALGASHDQGTPFEVRRGHSTSHTHHPSCDEVMELGSPNPSAPPEEPELRLVSPGRCHRARRCTRSPARGQWGGDRTSGVEVWEDIAGWGQDMWGGGTGGQRDGDRTHGVWECCRMQEQLKG